MAFAEQGANEIIVSAVNVMEAASSPDALRREALLGVLRSVYNGRRPIALPPSLLRTVTSAYAHGVAQASISVNREHDWAWQAIDRPGELSVEDATILDEERRNLERSYRRMHERGRLQLQHLVGIKVPLEARDIFQFLKGMSKDYEFFQQSIAFLIKGWEGAALICGREDELIRNSPFWRCFYASYGVSIYVRAVEKKNYGYSKNPGFFDIWQAMYLPLCDIFVTSDKALRKHLRLVAPFAGNRPKVMAYEALIRECALLSPEVDAFAT